MAAFLICALAIPSVFHETGLIFGIGYLIVIIVHGVMYLSAVGWKISQIIPMNLLAAAAVIAAGFVDGTGRYLLWLLAIVLHVLTSFLGARLQFQLKVGHFVERHGLLLLVALGESIIAIGVGHAELSLPFIVAAVLGLLLTAALWWIYFARDDEIAHDTMLARSHSDQLRQALSGYFYAFVPMLFGIILLATGIHSSIENLTDKLDLSHAFVFGGGVGLYLLGTILFRSASGIPQVIYRLLAALLALLTGFIGISLSAAFQFAGLILIAIVLVLVESHGSLVPEHK
jgi:low temperature requirement protein LtrA